MHERHAFSYNFQPCIGLTSCPCLSQHETCNFTVETIRTLLNAFENFQSWIFTSFHDVVIACVGGKKTGVHDVLESKKGQPTKMNFVKDTCPVTPFCSPRLILSCDCVRNTDVKFSFLCDSVSLECIHCLCKGCVLGCVLDFNVLNTSPVSTV